MTFNSLLLSLMLVSCASNGEKDPVEENQWTFVYNLPEAKNVGSTSAFIPVYDEGAFWLLFRTTKEGTGGAMRFLDTRIEKDAHGIALDGLDPETTYYYTMYTSIGYDLIYSEQVKSFTTKGVGIEFIEPDTVSMGNWDSLVPRIRTTDIDDSETHYHLFVRLYIWPKNDPENKSYSRLTRLVGNGVWTDDNTLEEDYCYQAFVYNTDGRIFAQTPVVVWTNGEMKVLDE